MFDLKTLRIKKGVRPVELAAEAGTTVQYIWMLENGERKTKQINQHKATRHYKTTNILYTSVCTRKFEEIKPHLDRSRNISKQAHMQNIH